MLVAWTLACPEVNGGGDGDRRRRQLHLQPADTAGERRIGLHAGIPKAAQERPLAPRNKIAGIHPSDRTETRCKIFLLLAGCAEVSEINGSYDAIGRRTFRKSSAPGFVGDVPPIIVATRP
jgi:hypothetical protein